MKLENVFCMHAISERDFVFVQPTDFIANFIVEFRLTLKIDKDAFQARASLLWGHKNIVAMEFIENSTRIELNIHADVCII